MAAKDDDLAQAARALEKAGLRAQIVRRKVHGGAGPDGKAVELNWTPNGWLALIRKPRRALLGRLDSVAQTAGQILSVPKG